MEPKANYNNFLVYDGDCPLCSRYVKVLRLQESIGPVTVVSARTDHPVVDRLQSDGFDLDEGIALVLGDKVYFGEECMTRLALVSTPVGVFNRLSAAIFRSPRISAFLYPILKAGRLVLLRILGRERIGQDAHSSH